MKYNDQLMRPGRFPGITRNAGNYGHDGKFHKSRQCLTRQKETLINYVLAKISRHKTVRIKFSVDSEFSNMLYGKKRKPGIAGNQQKTF